MKKIRGIVIGILLLVMVSLILGLFSCQKEEQEKPTFEIRVVTDENNEIPIYAHMDTEMKPKLVDDKGNVMHSSFRYEYDANVISIDENGKITPLVSESKKIEITIIELTTDTRDTFVGNIITDLAKIGSVLNENGEKVDLEAPKAFEIGVSYSYEFKTTPPIVDLNRFFTYTVVDAAGTEKNAFDVLVEGNTITFTPTGVGEGLLCLSFKNDAHRLDNTFTVPFVISFPDATFTQAVLKSANKTLLSVEEIQSIDRLVFDESVHSVSTAKSEKLTSLRTMVFESQEIVQMDLNHVADKMIFRVKGLDLYESYRADDAWGGIANRIYPYVNSVTDSVIVYHNEDTYSLADTILSTSGVVHLTKPDLKDYLSGDGTDLFVHAISAQTETVVLQKDGYRFVGWRDERGNIFRNEDIGKIKEGVHLWAVWEAEVYKLTLHDYNSADGSQNQQIEVKYHQEIPSLPNGLKNGWEFKGWYLTDDYLETEKVESGFVFDRTENITLYAKYEATLTLDYCGLLNDHTVTVVYGKALGDLLPEYSYINGWQFREWNTSTAYRAQDVITKDVPYVREGKASDGFSHTLYARTEKTVTFSDTVRNITYDIALISGLNLQESLAVVGHDWDDYAILYGSQYAEEVGKWTFVGWTVQNISLDVTSVSVFDSEQLIQGTQSYYTIGDTVYAVYSGNLRFIHGTVGDDNYIDQKVYCGFAYELPSDPIISSYEGYTYLGWLVDGQYHKEKTCRAIASTAGSCVYAYYNANDYYLKFYDEFGDELHEKQIIYHDVGYDLSDRVLNNDHEDFRGRTVILPVVPDKAGEWIPKWKLNGESFDGEYEYTVPKSVYGNQNFTAAYESGLCEIRFDTHGYGEVEPISVNYNYVIGALNQPPKTPEGYKFVGWFTNTTYSTEITSETYYRFEDKIITLYAKYVITLECEGYEQTDTVTLVYGSGVQLNDPADESTANENNWEFDGWYGFVKDHVAGKYVWKKITSTHMNSFVISLENNKLFARWKRELEIVPDPTDSGYFRMPGDVTTITVYRGEDFTVDKPISKPDCGWSFNQWYYYDEDHNQQVCANLIDLINVTNVEIIYAKYSASIEIWLTYKDKSVLLNEKQTIILGESFHTNNYRDAIADVDGYHFLKWKFSNSYFSEKQTFVVDKTVATGKWVIILSPNTYYIDYVLDPNKNLLNKPQLGGNGTSNKQTQTYDRPFTLVNAECDGYLFKGWEIVVNGEALHFKAGSTVENLTSVLGGTVTANAVWEPINYIVEYDQNTGNKAEDNAFSENNSFEYSYTDTFKTAAAPKRTGYSFQCWKVNNVMYEHGAEIWQLTTVNGATVSFKAVWAPITYNVVFDLTGGAWSDTLKRNGIKYDEKITVQTPEKAGYIFKGWFRGDNHEKVEEILNLADTQDAVVELYAKWEPITYKIVFDCRFTEQTDGVNPIFSVPPEDNFVYDTPYDIKDPQLAGYRFVGWYCDDTLTNEIKDWDEIENGQYQIKNLTANDGTTVYVYAKWEAIQYKIILNAGEGKFSDDNSSQKTVNAVYAKTISLATPKRDGYKFVGWLDANGTVYNDNASNLTKESGGEIALTAKWEPIEYEIKTDANGGIFADTGTDVGTHRYTYDQYGVPFTAPFKLGYNLIGWTTDPDKGEVEFGLDYTGEGNCLYREGEALTVYALWSPIGYEVIIDCAGGYYGFIEDNIPSIELPATYDDFDNPIRVADVQRPWYKLDGWIIKSVEKTEFVSSDQVEFVNLTATHGSIVVMEAVWTPVEYTITYYDSDGIIVGTSDFSIESRAFSHPPVPAKPYYTGTWNTSTLPVSEQDAPGNRTVTARYTPTVYHLNYTIDGTLVKQVLFSIENTQPLLTHVVPAVPEKVGYSVTWDDLDIQELSNAPRNVECKAICTPLEYTLEFYEDSQGQMLTSMQVTMDDESLMLPVLNGKDGYVSSWNFSLDQLAEWIEALPEGEKTVRVYATHTPIRYTVRVYAPDGTYNDYAYNAEQLTDMTLKIYAALDTQTYRYVCENAQITYDESNGYLTISVESLGDLTVSVVPVTFDHYYTVTLEDGCETHTLIFESKDMVVTSDFYRPSKVGYEFLEWTLSAEDDGGAVYSATWTPHTYTVVLDPQGGELMGSAVMSDLEYGVVYSIEQIPMRVGYSFVGWMNSETGDITVEIKDLCDINGGEVVFNAVWLPISYNVIFQTQFEIDGELVIIANQAAAYGESFRLASAPARTGYIFAGWEAEDGSVYVSEGLVQNLSTLNEDTVELTAKWMPIHYTIVFKDCDVEKVEMNYEGTHTLPTSKKNGYVLSGWQIVVNGVSQLYKIGDTVKNLSASDGDTVEVWAKWTRVTQMEGVTFRFDSYYADANGGLSMLPIHLESIDPNVPFKLPVAIKPGYEFVGWLDKETGTEYPRDTLISDLSAFKKQVNLTAVFSPADYTITFFGVSSTTYTVESMPIPPAVPAWKGYIGSWNIPENPIGDIVVYPVYTPITYTIVLDPTEGEINRTMIRVQYDTQVVLGTPTRSGYVFKGWTYNGNLYEGDLLLDMTLTDLDGETITLQAVWEEDVPVYTATFVVDGRVLTTMEFTEADLIRGTLIMPKVTPKAHYDGRWSIESLPAANVTVQAIYTPVLYSITFVANGHTETVMYYTVEAPLNVLPAVPFKTGYMNEKWESFAMDGGDLVVNAEYTPINYYCVMFDSMNGADILEVSATYDTEFTLPEIPVREGYSFSGWYVLDGKNVIKYNANEKALNLADTNGAVVYITAVWTANVYQMTFDSVADKTVEFTVRGILDMDKNKIPEIPAGLERACYSASWAIPDTLPATDITIYARYTEIEYKIVFDHLEELTGVSPKEVSWNISMGSLQEESFGDGYVWSLDPIEYKPYDLIKNLPETENDEDNYTLVLYPVLKKYAYTVTFGYDSKNVILIKNIDAGLNETVEIAVPDVPFKKGYLGEWVFTADDGYALEPGENNTICVTRLSENAATDLTVTVKYTPIQYTVRYDLAGGELAEGNTPADLLANYDGSYFVMDMVPSRVGYDFAGWVYTDADGNETVLSPASNSIINLTTVNHDVVVLKAKWVPIQYSVSVYMRYISGSKYETVEYKLRVAYDEEFVLEEMAPANYEQIGWKIGEDDEDDEDDEDEEYEEYEEYELNTVFKNLATDDRTVTIKPVLKGKEHTVELYANGVCVGTVKYCYGDDTYEDIVKMIQEVTPPEKTFYKGSWSIGSPVEYLRPSGEVTIFGADDRISEGSDRIIAEGIYNGDGFIVIPDPNGMMDNMIRDPNKYGVFFPLIIFADYTPIAYNVEFVIDGKKVKDTYTVENRDVYPEILEKEHYTASWDIDTLPGGDVTVTAVYTPIVYTVTFALPDGTVVDISQYTVEDKTVHMPAVPYGYDAWDIAPLVCGDVTVYALKKNDQNDPIILTFVDSLGNRVGAVTVEEGKQLPPLPTVPEIQGYMGNWKLPETVTESMTVYPEYELIEYRVYFYDENGELVPVIGMNGLAMDYATYTILDNSVIIPAVPAKEHYTGRWDISALTTGDVEVHAVYEPTVYKIFFKTHDGKLWATRHYTIENQHVDNPDVPKREGYDRQVWEEYDLSIMLNGMDVFPIYSAAEYIVPLGDTGVTKKVIFGELYGELISPSRDGYTFEGWYFNGKQITDKTLVTYPGNHTLTPNWIPNTYSITYDYNGGSGSPSGKTVTFDDVYGSLPTPTRTGYTFQGWVYEGTYTEVTSDTKVIKAEDHKLVAQWDVNTYKLTIVAENVSVTVKRKFPATSLGGKQPKNEFYNGDYVSYGTSLIISVTPNSGYENATYSIEMGNACITAINNTFTMPADNITIKASATAIPSSCLVKGSPIMLPDGSYTEIENLNIGDAVMTFDHITGEFVPSSIAYVFYSYSEVKVISLKFNNGVEIQMANGGHGAFDETLNRYVLITPDNAADFVGHSFSYVEYADGQAHRSSVVLTDYRISDELVERYDIVTANKINHITNGVLSCSDGMVTISNVFDFADDQTYDKDKMAEDIERYGLFSCEEWSDYVSQEDFDTFNGAYFKIAIGKGLMTEADIFKLITDLENEWMYQKPSVDESEM